MRWLRSWWPTVIWGFAILVATLIPASRLPQPPNWGFSIDKLVHFTIFAVWSLLILYADFHHNKLPRIKNYLMIVTLGVLYGLLLETSQIWIPGRYFSWPDIAANSLGSSLGAVGFWLYAKFTSQLV